jgi:hypothetical protein
VLDDPGERAARPSSPSTAHHSASPKRADAWRARSRTQTCPNIPPWTPSTTLNALSSPVSAQFRQVRATADQAAGGSDPSQRADRNPRESPGSGQSAGFRASVAPSVGVLDRPSSADPLHRGRFPSTALTRHTAGGPPGGAAAVAAPDETEQVRLAHAQATMYLASARPPVHHQGPSRPPAPPSVRRRCHPPRPP